MKKDNKFILYLSAIFSFLIGFTLGVGYGVTIMN